MSRPTHTDIPQEWSIHIPSSLNNFYFKLLEDPLRGTFSYGIRAKLVTELLRQLQIAIREGEAEASFEPALRIIRQQFGAIEL